VLENSQANAALNRYKGPLGAAQPKQLRRNMNASWPLKPERQAPSRRLKSREAIASTKVIQPLGSMSTPAQHERVRETQTDVPNVT